MDFAFALAILAVILFFFGIGLGAKIGSDLAKNVVTTADFWKQVAKVLVVLALLTTIISALTLKLFLAPLLGVAVGAISVLKMDFGESIGPWRIFDSKLRANSSQIKRAGSKKAEQVRRARKLKEEEPEADRK